MLDALLHAPEMPLAGPGSPAVGLGLWNHLPLALGLEVVVTALGLGLYLGGKVRPRRPRAVVALVAIVGAGSWLDR